jgi:heme/copper-type cytochrome/quinol oxidase subunit 3
LDAPFATYREGRIFKVAMKDVGLRIPAPESGPPIPRGRIGIWLLLAVETMFFVGILGAYVIVRKNAGEWPPRYEVVIEGLKRPDGFPVTTTFQPPRFDLKLPLLNALALTAATLAAFRARKRALIG